MGTPIGDSKGDPSQGPQSGTPNRDNIKRPQSGIPNRPSNSKGTPIDLGNPIGNPVRNPYKVPQKWTKKVLNWRPKLGSPIEDPIKGPNLGPQSWTTIGHPKRSFWGPLDLLRLPIVVQIGVQIGVSDLKRSQSTLKSLQAPGLDTKLQVRTPCLDSSSGLKV